MQDSLSRTEEIFVQYFLDFCGLAVKNGRKFTGYCLDSITNLKMFSK